MKRELLGFGYKGARMLIVGRCANALLLLRSEVSAKTLTLAKREPNQGDGYVAWYELRCMASFRLVRCAATAAIQEARTAE